MLRVLYILGTGSRNDNQELRWSLRSLDKYAQDDVQPIIVGAIPDWFKGEGAFYEDKLNRKEKNIGAKIRYAIEQGFVDGAFQISADDHFWRKPVVLSELPIYFRQASMPEFTEGNNYAKAIGGTRNALLAAGYSILNTTVHCNAWCHTDDLGRIMELEKMVRESDGEELALAREFGLVQWAAWPNVYIGSGRTPRHRISWKKDVKLGEANEKELAGVKDALIWSCNDEAFLSKPFVKIMREDLSGKCRWER